MNADRTEFKTLLRLRKWPDGTGDRSIPPELRGLAVIAQVLEVPGLGQHGQRVDRLDARK